MSVHELRQPGWKAEASYSKSAETRAAILQAALKAFGEADFAAVSTRQVAAEAGVNQPAINYYFRNKEGLYLACAEEIVARFVAHTGAAAEAAEEALQAGASAGALKKCLKALFRALVGVAVTTDEVTDIAGFLFREIQQKGPAYRLMYAALWLPGVDLVARLIAAICRSEEINACRIEALMMISSLSAFSSGKAVSSQMIGWREIGAAEAEQIIAVLDRQVEALKARK